MQSTPQDKALVSPVTAPRPIAPELLKLIGGGGAVSTSTPTPQAPKNKW